jgi:cytoskeletal protein CcmA (bactofilin family)
VRPRARATRSATAEGFLQLGRGARHEGGISGEGLALVHGAATGELDWRGDLIVAPGGSLTECSGRVERLRIEGAVSGSLSASGAVEVAAGGDLRGEVVTGEIQASPGASIEAHLRVRASSEH